MPDDELRYDLLVENAMRGLVREVLVTTGKRGLPGDHHFYITFLTEHPGVSIPGHLRARHPGEMTIVLQHQFWDLEVDDSKFAVTLSFGGKSERLVVPFASVVGFADPSVKFALQFQPMPVAEEAAKPPPPAEKKTTATAEAGDKVVTLDAFRKK
jgi:hypothetical protein